MLTLFLAASMQRSIPVSVQLNYKFTVHKATNTEAFQLLVVAHCLQCLLTNSFSCDYQMKILIPWANTHLFTTLNYTHCICILYSEKCKVHSDINNNSFVNFQMTSSQKILLTV